MNSALFFLATLLIFYVLIRRYSYIYMNISQFGKYLQVTAFPSHSNFEHFKFSLLRPLFGFILLFRAYNIHRYLTPEDLTSSIYIWSALGIIAAILLIIGLFTQYSLLFLVFAMWQYGDSVMGTGTLGNDIGAMLSILLFLTGAGRNLSVDGVIANRSDLAEKLLLYTKAYSEPENIALAKFVALASYWAICVYSVSMHINEPAWMSGEAGVLLLTNNFMSSPYLYFESLFISSEMAVHIARVLLWLMMIWYHAILPFTLMGGWWRKYVIVWGMLFLIFCISILNLGSLVEIEFIFWAAIFWSKVEGEKISIFYDDKCNLCDKAVQIISKLDIFDCIRIKPISENIDTLNALNIDCNNALNELYGVLSNGSKIYFGYDLYILLSRKVVLLWPFYPILLIGKYLFAGPVLYRFIAKRRRRLFGVCSVSKGGLQGLIEGNKLRSTCYYNNFNYSVIIHATFLILCYLVFIPAPYIGVKGSQNASTVAAHFYGITPINVFNKTDLRMAENWFTLESLEYNEIVPIFTDKGVRLQMHKSDRIYFGKTLRYRRSVIGKKGCISKPIMLNYLSKVYLSNKSATPGKYSFEYKQYYQALADSTALVQGEYKKNKIEVRCEFKYQVSYLG